MEFTSAQIADYLKSEQEHNPFIEAIDREISAAYELAQRSELQTPEGKLTATFLYSCASVMRPLFADPDFPKSDLTKPMGGPSHNPHSPIDLIGGIIADRVMKKFPELPPMLLRIEEHAEWELTKQVSPATKKHGKPSRIMVIDPCDMTSLIQSDASIQSSGMAIYDTKGTLLSAGIIGLSRDTQVIVEKVPKKNRYQTFGSTNEASGNTRKIGYIHRRLTDGTPIPKGIQHLSKENLFPSVSGSAVLELFDGTIDMLIDPKGQPWYELAIWGAVAKTLGYEVCFINGQPIDFSSMIIWGTMKNDDLRFPMIMARNKQILDSHLKQLYVKSPTYRATGRILDIFTRIRGDIDVPTEFIGRLTGASKSTVEKTAKDNIGCMYSINLRQHTVSVRPDAQFVIGGTGMSVYRHDDLASNGPKSHFRSKRRGRGAVGKISKHIGYL